MKYFFKPRKKDLNYFQANRKYNIKPFGDVDKDGVRNIFDCRPFNRYKQGIIHAISGYDTENKAKLMLKDAEKILQQALIEYQKGNNELGETLEKQAQELALQAKQIYEQGQKEIREEKQRIQKNVRAGLKVKKQKKIKTHTPPFFTARSKPVDRLYKPPWMKEKRKLQKYIGLYEQKETMFSPLVIKPATARIYFIR